jgi:Response regulator containing CheY-like receiver, AAA-type ATPase, and DNA-binding domains
MSRRILVVDDEEGIRGALSQLLEYEGYEVRAASNAADGIAEYTKWRPHLVFLDVKMAGIDGLEALKRIRDLDPTATVVIISGHATIRTAVEATQLGAYDILEKPLDTTGFWFCSGTRFHSSICKRRTPGSANRCSRMR